MPTILVIDDDQHVRGMLRTVLEDFGYKVLEAPDGNIGVQLFSENRVDLIITDIIMPDKEGLETIREIKASSPDAKIIAISGGAKVGPGTYLKLAERLGAQRVFEKPIQISVLLSSIAELLTDQKTASPE
jgi:CheY-like chemotaxis protein